MTSRRGTSCCWPGVRLPPPTGSCSSTSSTAATTTGASTSATTSVSGFTITPTIPGPSSRLPWRTTPAGSSSCISSGTTSRRTRGEAGTPRTRSRPASRRRCSPRSTGSLWPLTSSGACGPSCRRRSPPSSSGTWTMHRAASRPISSTRRSGPESGRPSPACDSAAAPCPPRQRQGHGTVQGHHVPSWGGCLCAAGGLPPSPDCLAGGCNGFGGLLSVSAPQGCTAEWGERWVCPGACPLGKGGHPAPERWHVGHVPACACGAACSCPLTAPVTAPLRWPVPCLCAAGTEWGLSSGSRLGGLLQAGLGGGTWLGCPGCPLYGPAAERGPGRDAEGSRGAAGGRGVRGTHVCDSFPPRPPPSPPGTRQDLCAAGRPWCLVSLGAGAAADPPRQQNVTCPQTNKRCAGPQLLALRVPMATTPRPRSPPTPACPRLCWAVLTPSATWHRGWGGCPTAACADPFSPSLCPQTPSSMSPLPRPSVPCPLSPVRLSPLTCSPLPRTPPPSSPCPQTPFSMCPLPRPPLPCPLSSCPFFPVPHSPGPPLPCPLSAEPPASTGGVGEGGCGMGSGCHS